MAVRAFTVINQLGESLRVELAKPRDTGFQVNDIRGLTPPKATINVSRVSTLDGTIYNSAQIDGRNIVLTLGLLNVSTIEEARLRSYKYFPIKGEVTLIFETDKRTAMTTGYVESNDPNMFDKEIQTTISIVCQDAYLLDASENNIISAVFYGKESRFEFPFSNESLTQPLIELGSLVPISSRVINYPGDGETGVIISIHVLGEATNIVVYNVRTNESMRIDTDRLEEMIGSGLVAGDHIVINTQKGKKSIKLFRGSAQYNILNALDRDVHWLTLRKGDNEFTYDTETGDANLQVTIESVILYEGV